MPYLRATSKASFVVQFYLHQGHSSGHSPISKVLMVERLRAVHSKKCLHQFHHGILFWQFLLLEFRALPSEVILMLHKILTL